MRGLPPCASQIATALRRVAGRSLIWRGVWPNLCSNSGGLPGGACDPGSSLQQSRRILCFAMAAALAEATELSLRR
jgi:hypothetical protein